METQQQLLTTAYAAFNARDIDAVLAVMQPDVQWANGMEGGYVYGHTAVREYWLHQWSLLDPQVEPAGFHGHMGDQVVVDVHQVVHDLAGNLLVDQMVQHRYTFRDDLIQKMDIQT